MMIAARQTIAIMTGDSCSCQWQRLLGRRGAAAVRDPPLLLCSVATERSPTPWHRGATPVRRRMAAKEGRRMERCRGGVGGLERKAGRCDGGLLRKKKKAEKKKVSTIRPLFLLAVEPVAVATARNKRKQGRAKRRSNTRPSSHSNVTTTKDTLQTAEYTSYWWTAMIKLSVKGRSLAGRRFDFARSPAPDA
jgi:hypothetical protein